MRMVVCGRGAESPTGAVRQTLVRSLTAFGHVAVGFDPTRHGDEVTGRTRQLVALLDGVEADLCVVVPTPGDLDTALLRRAAADREILTMALHGGTIYPGAPTRPGDVAEHATDFDVVAVPDADGVVRARPWARHAVVELVPAVTPEALDEPPEGAVDVAAVVCVGDADHDNAAIVRALTEVGVELVVLGSGWDAVADLREHLPAGRPSPMERNALLAAADLVVELPATLADRSIADCAFEQTGLSQPALDAAALGTAVVALARPGIVDHLEPDTEIVVAQSADDLPDLVRLLLSVPESLRELGLAAQQRLRVEHQWRHRWAALWDWFGGEAPLTGASSSTSGVTVIVPVDDGVGPGELTSTIESLRSTDSRCRVVVVGSDDDLARAGSERWAPAEWFRVVETSGDLAVRIAAATSWVSSAHVMVLRPGAVVPPGRLDAQIAVLEDEPDVDVVVGGHDGPGAFHRWDLVHRWVVAGEANLGGALFRRRTLSDRLGPSLLAGRVDVVVDAARTLRFRAIDVAPVPGASAPVPVRPADVPLAGVFPQIRRCEDRGRALAGGYLLLAADLADEQPAIASELVALAHDHLPEVHPLLAPVLHGEPARSSELRVAAGELAGELRAVAPTTEDRVWHQGGGLIANHRLVLDVDWDAPGPGLALVAAYARTFSAGEPVELALVVPAGALDSTISRIAAHLSAGGIDVESAADITALEVYERSDGDLVVRLRGVSSMAERVAEAETWMVETRAELDLVSAGAFA